MILQCYNMPKIPLTSKRVFRAYLREIPRWRPILIRAREEDRNFQANNGRLLSARLHSYPAKSLQHVKTSAKEITNRSEC